MSKTSIIEQFKREKLVAVVRGESEEQVSKTVDAIIDGGIHIIEITYTIPDASTIIANLVKKYEDDENVIIGAGTCLDPITARDAILHGAKFVVSPHFDKEIMKIANLYAVPVMPGATTVVDMVECMKYGASIIKLFPGDNFGPSSIKSFKGPLPQAEFMPTGGVSAENLKDWLENGVISVGTGGSLTGGAKTGDYHKVTSEAQKLVSIVRDFQNA